MTVEFKSHLNVQLTEMKAETITRIYRNQLISANSKLSTFIIHTQSTVLSTREQIGKLIGQNSRLTSCESTNCVVISRFIISEREK